MKEIKWNAPNNIGKAANKCQLRGVTCSLPFLEMDVNIATDELILTKFWTFTSNIAQ